MRVDKQKLYALYQEGVNVDEIAKRCGCSVNYALELIHRKYGKTRIDTGKVKALWNAGWSINSIMYDMNISEEEVRKVVIHEAV